jgi:fibronectin type 3 domain-containing protein
MKKVRTRRIGFEQLERREMMSAGPALACPTLLLSSNHLGGAPASLVGPMLSSSATTVSAPTSVKATFVTSTNQMQISWSLSAGATSYNVYRSTTNNSNTAVCIGSAISGSSFVDKSPVTGTTYFYWVKACKGSTLSAFSSVAQCADTDRTVVVTKTISADTMLKVINFTKDLVDDIQAILAWDPAPKPSVSGTIDSLKATVTETLIETPSNAIVSGTASVSATEAGHVTGQIGAGIPYIASVAVGVTVNESCTISLTESYSTSTGWVVNGTSTHIVGAFSATGFGTATVIGYTGEVDLSAPSITFSGTGSGQVTIKPSVSLNVAYSVSGHGLHQSGTLYHSPALALPAWSFNLGNLSL